MSWQILKLGKLIGEYPDSWSPAAAELAFKAFLKQYGGGKKLKMVRKRERNPGKSGRFERCLEEMSSRGGVDDPAAVCAASLRKTGWTPRRRKRNPAESAAALSEAFHGRPEESESVIDEAVHVHSHLTFLAGMEEIQLAKGRGKIRFGHDVRLASNEDGSQLFLIGGDQSIDLDAFPEVDPTKERVVLGHVKSVTYNTAKFHLGKSDRKPGPYVHPMGEESGDQPELIYDTINERLSFVGGHYQIRPEGIVD